jgi:hypothetical protein
MHKLAFDELLNAAQCRKAVFLFQELARRAAAASRMKPWSITMANGSIQHALNRGG